MKFLSTRVHGVLDYGLGVILLVAPYLLGFADGTAAQWVPMALGAAAIVYSLLTRYELGVVRLIPMPAHLAIDAVSGILLAVSPWLFGFANVVWIPHVVLGVLELGTSLVTRTTPETDFAAVRQPGE